MVFFANKPLSNPFGKHDTLSLKANNSCKKSSEQSNFANRFLRETGKNTFSWHDHHCRMVAATTNGKITAIPATKELEWRETVDAMSKRILSNLIYEFTFIFDLLSRWTGDIQRICMSGSPATMPLTNVFTKISTTRDIPVALSLGLM